MMSVATDEKLALNGDDAALERLRCKAAEKDLVPVMLVRHLQVRYYTLDGKEWHQHDVTWTPWHQYDPEEPSFLVDETDGTAFATARAEKAFHYIKKTFLNPLNIIKLHHREKHRFENLVELQRQLKEAVETENYEQAAAIRDEISARANK